MHTLNVLKTVNHIAIIKKMSFRHQLNTERNCQRTRDQNPAQYRLRNSHGHHQRKEQQDNGTNPFSSP